jgi:hypothetical protein
MRLLVLLLLLTGQLSAGPLDDRLTIRADAGYAFHIDGYTRLRQFDTEGDRLDLREDLGVDNWPAFSLEAAWRFDRAHALSTAFACNLFRGEGSLGRDVTHEGATFAAGTELSFDRTSWWRLEAWYQYTPWRVDYAAFTLLGGALIDFVDVHVVADREPASGSRDDHENFGTLAMPMPAIGVRLELTPVGELILALEARGTYARNLPTWHTDDGGTEHSQTAISLALEVGYRVAELEFGAALMHQTLYLEQTNEEDGNEFAAQGTFVRLFLRLWL